MTWSRSARKSNKIAISALCAFLSGVQTIQAAGQDADNTFAIRNVRMFDGVVTLARANLVVRDGRIVAAGTDAPIPSGTEIIDGTGKTLLPGLIDSHVHVLSGTQMD